MLKILLTSLEMRVNMITEIDEKRLVVIIVFKESS